jgi:FAD/FMN-containing dehydrogenase
MRLDLSSLRDTFHGSLVTPADPGYEAARVLFNTRVRRRPEVLARCAGTADVVAAVRFARDAGAPISVRSGGHHACGFSLADGGVVVDVGGLKNVSFDPATGTVVAGAGCSWRDIDRLSYLGFSTEGEAGLVHGYAPPGGECPTVGISGYSLGGGYGLLSRRFGLACDHILAATVVDADGNVLRASEDENPDLYWALRGAGGAGLGVVTDLTYRLDLVPKAVYGGVIAWPIDQAEDVLRLYRDLYVGHEDDRLSFYMALTTDPYPEGEQIIVLYGLYIGPPDEAEAALAPIRSLGQPVFDGLESMSYWDLQTALGDEIRYGLQLKWRGGYFSDDGFNDDAFAGIVDSFRRIPSGYTMIRFDLLGGGAVGIVPADATAFVHRSRMFYISAISLWQRDDETEAGIAWVDGLMDSMRPYLSDEVYQNYADEDLDDWQHAYYGANYARLQQVKQRYDPTDFFHHPQSIRLP